MTKKYSYRKFMVYRAAKRLLVDLGEMPTGPEVSEKIEKMFDFRMPYTSANYYMRLLHSAGKLPKPHTHKTPSQSTRMIRADNMGFGVAGTPYTRKDPYTTPLHILFGA